MIAGCIGVVVPDLGQLQARLKAVQDRLVGTKFQWRVEENDIAVTCPWGNRFRCHHPAEVFGDMELGIPYVEFQARPGTVEGITRFYRDLMRAPAAAASNNGFRSGRIEIGRNQWLVFKESGGDIPPYDGHHIAVYVSNFSGPFTSLEQRGLTMDVRNHQFRFKDLIDPETNEKVFELDHEVRSLHHPLYHRFLTNRDPTQTNRSYKRGRDAVIPFGTSVQRARR